MRKLLMIGLILVLASCKSKKMATDASQQFVLENLSNASSTADLRNLHPNAEIKEGTDIFEEGTVERDYTILYPDTENEILITWKDENRTQIHNIRVENDGDWKSETGISIGTTYDDLVKMNGPVNVYGFGWDYSGAVDWNGGKLADTNVRVFLAPENSPPGKFYGDGIIEPTEEELEALDLKVQAILFQKTE